MQTAFLSPANQQYELAVPDSRTVSFFPVPPDPRLKLSSPTTTAATHMGLEGYDRQGSHSLEGRDYNLPAFVAGDPDAAAENIHQIPPLPPSSLYESFDRLHRELQEWAKANGAAFVKQRSSNYRDIDGSGNKVVTNVVLACDRGHRRPSRGAGLRRTSTTKIDCEYTVTASDTKKNN